MRVLLFLAVSLGAASAAAGQTGGTTTDSASYALTSVTLIDGTGAPARPGTTIVVTGDRIADVFPDGSRPLPPGARTPNVTGRYVIPGLIDTHVHLATDPSNDDSLPLTERKLRSALLGGITTVRDMAGDARQLGFLARAAAVGDIASPSIYYSALFAGPDFFTDPRVHSTSAAVTLGEAPWARSVTLLAFEIDSAPPDWRRRNRLDYAKIPANDSTLDRLLRSMAARGTIFEPTLFVYWTRDSTSAALRWGAAITRRANQVGVAISAGTDMMVGNEADIQDSPPHLQQELALLVRAGLTPGQALVAATSTAARVIGVDSLVGTVTAGKYADLVVLTADPLADISNTRRIEMVVHRGVVYRQGVR
ncbi:MAG: amidohydrolase family protein [Gemmatimonadota bacterium]